MLNNLSILLIDDDPVFHFINTKILQNLGLTKILTAINGEEALKLITHTESEDRYVPNAIFVDLNMPILDGFGFIEAFKRLGISEQGNVNIAILTSSSNSNDRERAKQLGINHYFTKPVSEDAILSILQTVGG